MKLLRYGPNGAEKPGLLDNHGNIRSLAEYIPDINPKFLCDYDVIDVIKQLNTDTLPFVQQPIRLGACIDRPGKILCVGFNSKLHAQEMGVSVSKSHDIIIFLKPSTCACGPNDPIIFTAKTQKLDWEAELGVIIGKKGKYIKPAEAKDYIFGYTCVNDLSERYFQFETSDTQFTKGKGFDNAAPMGPVIVTSDEIANSSNLNIKLWVNGQLRQDFNTRDYLYNDIKIISYVSQFFTLYPGDVISMGSAPGSAKFWGEDFYLKPNDHVEFEIEEIGKQDQVVIHE